MKTPRCDAHAKNTKFTDSEGWEALARDLEWSLGVWIQHAKEVDRKLAEALDRLSHLASDKTQTPVTLRAAIDAARKEAQP